MAAPELTRGTTIDRRGASWTVRRRMGGRRIRRSFRTYEDAYAFATAASSAGSARELRVIAHANDTLQDWFDRWLVAYAPLNLATTTVRVYVDVYTRHVEPALGSVRLSELEDRLQSWANDLDQVGIATGRKARCVLASVLRHAVREGALARFPLGGVVFTTPPATPRTFSRAATPLFVERMLRLVNAADGVIIGCTAYAGMRPEEAVAMTPAAIKHGGTALWVGQTIAWGRISAIKNCKARAVPLLPPLRAQLEAFIAARSPRPADGLLIRRQDGQPWSVDDYRNFRARFKRARRWAGDPDQRPKDMRAAYATMLLEASASVVTVARHLGDREDTVARHYYRYRDDPERLLPPEQQILRAREQVDADPPRRPAGGRPRRRRDERRD